MAFNIYTNNYFNDYAIKRYYTYLYIITYIHIQTLTHTHTHIHTHTHTHAYTYMTTHIYRMYLRK